MSDAKYLGCETVEEKRAKALAEQTAAENKYRIATKTLQDFEASVYRLVEDDAIRARRHQLIQARQQACEAMNEARWAFDFASRCTAKGVQPPSYRPELDRRGDWIKR